MYVLLSIFVGLSIVFAYILFLGLRDLRIFFSKYNAIESEAALDDFKSLARGNMKAAAFMLLVGVFWLLIALYLVINYAFPAGIVVAAITTPIAIFSIKMNKIEKSSRNLACNPELHAEYARISETWVKRPWPDF